MTTLHDFEGIDILKQEPDCNPSFCSSRIASGGIGALPYSIIEDIVSRFTYKPGWTFQAVPNPEPHPDWPNGTFFIRVTSIIPQSNDPTVFDDYTHDHIFLPKDHIYVCVGDLVTPLWIDRPSLRRAIRWYLEYREIHELREWLKYDGEYVDYPPH